MILCKQCNRVRHNDASPCDHCLTIMTITERAAASLHIPEREFFENVLLELDGARMVYRETPTFETLHNFTEGLGLLKGAELYVRLVIIATLVTRIYVESVPQENTKQTLDELDNQLKGR